MAFPQDPTTLRAEFLIDGTWVDVTDRVRDAGDIVIERGYRSEQGNTITVDQCTFNLDNPDGLFSNRNPNSIYYGLLGRNVQFRVAAATVPDRALVLYNQYINTFGHVTTADKAVLDITSDIDIRGDILPLSWTPEFGYILASKMHLTLAEDSWLVTLESDGTLKLRWTTNGAGGTLVTATSTAAVATSGRKAWRVTLDVVNGANKTVTFYTADTIAGSWVQLGSVVTTAGNTSIFSSVSDVVVGDGASGQTFAGVTVPSAFAGRYYGFELYNGIAGTKVADADFTTQAVSATSWSDGLGTPNTWIVSDVLAAIQDGTYQFWGECFEFPSTWDSTGTDVTVNMVAASVTRRILRNDESDSSLTYYFKNRGSAVIGHWPLSGVAGATIAANTITGGADATLVNAIFGVETDLPASEGVVTLGNDTSSIEVGPFPSATAVGVASPTVLNMNFMFKYDSAADFTDTPELFQFGVTGGTVYTWFFDLDDTTFFIAGGDKDGNILGSVFSAAHTMDLTQWVVMMIQVTTSGGNIVVNGQWYQASQANGITGPDGWEQMTTNYCVGSAIGRCNSWIANPFPGSFPSNNGAKITQVAVVQEDMLSTSDAGTAYWHAVGAYDQEGAAVRFLRLGGQRSITAQSYGTSEGEPLGPQRPKSVPELLQECSDVDGGFIFSSRYFNGMEMQPRDIFINQTALALDYSLKHFDDTSYFKPTDDDKVLLNDVTVSRPNGGSARSEITSGPNNVSDPTEDPQGVGRYDTSYERNASSDSRLSSLAGFATYLGTWDQIRLPQLKVSLERSVFVSNSDLSYALQLLEIGQSVSIDNLPSWMPPELLETLTRGFTVTLGNRKWEIVFNNQAYGPFRSQELVETTLRRAAGEFSTLNASLTTTANSFVVNTEAGRSKWAVSASKPSTFPLDIFIGGELMTVGAISTVTGTSPQQQTFSSVTRSVNGIVKAHDATDKVTVAKSFYAGL